MHAKKPTNSIAVVMVDVTGGGEAPQALLDSSKAGCELAAFATPLHIFLYYKVFVVLSSLVMNPKQPL